MTADDPGLPPPDERAREEAAEAAGVDPTELTTESGDPPVATEAGRAYSIRAALAAARQTRRAARRALAVAAGALLLAVAIATLSLTGVIGGGDDPEPVIDPEDIVKKVFPSTVRITAEGKGGLRSEGSGWVLDAEEGLIVTNFHVVSGGAEFDVVTDGDFRNAKLLGAAPCDDLAVLKTDDTGGLKTLPLASGADVDQGEAVVALGYAANLSLGEEISSTAGIISVESSADRIPAPDSPEFEDLLQTDTPLNPGNSGGPLVNDEGELVGVNTAILTQLGGQPIQSQGYAIGVDRTKEVVTGLRKGRSAGWFGTGLQVPPRAVQRRERLKGIATGAAPDTTGADERLEGALITAVNGRRLKSDIADYCDAVEDVESGDSAELRVSPRPGKPLREISVEFE